jgi:5-methylcytosine-specific restriction protein A
MALKRFCLKQGCTILVDEGYCESHKQENHEYDKHRESSYKRGYDARWRKARARHLKKSPLCLHCLDDGLYKAATVVDHIKPHKGNKILFWDTENWQSLCKPHHDRKTVQEDGGFGNGHR